MFPTASTSPLYTGVVGAVAGGLLVAVLNAVFRSQERRQDERTRWHADRLATYLSLVEHAGAFYSAGLDLRKLAKLATGLTEAAPSESATLRAELAAEVFGIGKVFDANDLSATAKETFRLMDGLNRRMLDSFTQMDANITAIKVIGGGDVRTAAEELSDSAAGLIKLDDPSDDAKERFRRAEEQFVAEARRELYPRRWWVGAN